jgi:hypothetical protein
MGASNRAKDAAKRYLSPDAQQALKSAYSKVTGPRRPSRLRPAPTDPEGAARHAILTAHSTRRPADHLRARKAFGIVVLDDQAWTAATPPAPSAATATESIDVIVVAALSAAPREPSAGTLTLGLPGSTGCAHVLLPNAADLLADLGAHEQAAVFTSVAAGIVAGRAVRNAIAIPSDDPVAAAVARSLERRASEGGA